MGRLEKTLRRTVGSVKADSSLFLTDSKGRQLFISCADFFKSGEIKESIGGSFGNTYFVAPEGNDEEAKVGQITNPWKTISAARDQAVLDELTASLVYVYPWNI